MAILEYSGWDFVTESGVELDQTVTPYTYIGASAGHFHVKRFDSPTVYRLYHNGFGGGFGVSQGLSRNLSGSLSLPHMPGFGSRIYRHPLRSGSLLIQDFVGEYVVLRGSVSIAAGSGIAIIFIGAPSWLIGTIRSFPSSNPIERSAIMTAATCQGVGVIGSSAAMSGVSTSLGLFLGSVIAALPWSGRSSYMNWSLPHRQSESNR